MDAKIRSNKLLWPLSIVLAVIYIAAGATKLVSLPMMEQKFSAWGYPDPLMLLVGAVEIIGAVLLLVPKAASVGAVALGAVMIGAIYTHLFRGIAVLAIVPLLMLVLLAFIGNRRLDSPFARQSKRQMPPSWPRPEARQRTS